MIRVGHVVTNIWDGGIERVVHQIATGLPRDRFECIVYALTADNPWKAAFESDGIRVRTYDARNRGGLAPTFAANFRALTMLARDLSADRIDVLNAHDFYPGVMGRTAAILARVPRIYTTLHNTYSWLDRRHGLVNRMLALGTDRVVGVSNACIEDSLRRDKIPRDRYVVIPNGVDESRFHPRPEAKPRLLAELGWPENTFIVGNIGTFSPRKDQRTLLRAFETIADAHPAMRVVIVGSERKHEQETADELRTLSSSPDLEGRIRILSDRKDIEEVVAGFDVFCMPSKVEGFGLALVEAMMSGIPCVVSDIPAFREIAGGPPPGSLFHAVGDHSSLALHLSELRLAPERRTAIAKAGLSSSRIFTLQRMLESYAGLYSNTKAGSS